MSPQGQGPAPRLAQSGWLLDEWKSRETSSPLGQAAWGGAKAPGVYRTWQGGGPGPHAEAWTLRRHRL